MYSPGHIPQGVQTGVGGSLGTSREIQVTGSGIPAHNDEHNTDLEEVADNYDDILHSSHWGELTQQSGPTVWCFCCLLSGPIVWYCCWLNSFQFKFFHFFKIYFFLLSF